MLNHFQIMLIFALAVSLAFALLSKQRAGERATQPIKFVERFAYVWAALCAVGVCIWEWHAIRTWVASLAPGPISLNFDSFWNSFSQVWSSAAASLPSKSAYVQGPALIAAVSVAILLIVVGFAAYFTHSEE